MAQRRRGHKSDAQLGFDALAIEGALLAPEWLGRIASLEAAAQAEADYGIEPGLTLRDEISRYWRMAQSRFEMFKAQQPASSQGFVVPLLQKCFGFQSLMPMQPVVLEQRTYPIGYAALEGRVPVVIAPAGVGLDVALPQFGDGSRKRSAFGLVQEYLNAAEGSLWGLVCDGYTLRIVRDNASMTRPAWIEADLGRIFTEPRYPDFALLWLLAQETRFGKPGQPVAECALEAWRNAGREEGTRAREHLRQGVEEALLALGQGFLSHPDNTALRQELYDGRLTPKEYFNQLLRLVYRLIFTLTAEERGVLHTLDSDTNARSLYAQGYSMRRLRERSVRRSAHDTHHDLWEATRITFSGLATGQPLLALPALAGLFAASQCPHLDGCRLQNRHLLLAMFKLGWLRESTGLSRVNWRDMGPEELGSVYESLLELVPQLGDGGRTFRFAQGGETKGNARKTSGSYYTPDSLVQVLLDSALEPVIQQTISANPDNPAEALLNLTVVDPACGSGHFLLAAARRIAMHVARLQSAGTPSASEFRRAVRQVVGRCIFGVDLNPMAVELCRVSLWMEAVEPGLPLTFLRSHIQQGNSLLGTTPELMAKNVPDVAFDPIEGDDRKVASELKKRNKSGGGKQLGFEGLWGKPVTLDSTVVAKAVSELDAAPDSDLPSLAKKEGKYEEILGSEAYRHQRFVANAWCAAFVWPKQAGDLAAAAPTNDMWRTLKEGRNRPPALTQTTVDSLATQYGFFHWHLQFPQVFARGGFDVVLGNPPWERVKLQEQEFFASRDEQIANAPNAAARKKLIAALPTDPLKQALFLEWIAASRQAEGESHLVRNSGRFPLCGRGDVNTYSVFAEHNRSILQARGRAGFIVPPGLATDDTTKAYFQELIRTASLVALYEFENEEFLFPGIDHRVRFITICISGSSGLPMAADISFGNRSVASLGDRNRHFALSPADFLLLNPNTRTCPTFRGKRDAELNIAIYRRTGVLWREEAADGNPWGIRFLRMLDMANDSDLFRTAAQLQAEGWKLLGNRFRRGDEWMLPLVEAKMVHHFDHRFGTYQGQTEAQSNQGKLPELTDEQHADPNFLTLPDYWVPAGEVASRLSDKWDRGWLLGWRKIARSTDQRTLLASLFPIYAVGDSQYIILPNIPDPARICSLYSCMTSFSQDYAARQKVGGSNFVYHTFKQLPILPPSTYSQPTPWHQGMELSQWLVARVVELTYTAWDLEAFGRDVGYEGPPFRWDPARRPLLRAELDAAFFHLYLPCDARGQWLPAANEGAEELARLTASFPTPRHAVEYIMETFPIVRRNDEKAHGEYRTKRLILHVYDAMLSAMATGSDYQTLLTPPPAADALRHPGR